MGEHRDLQLELENSLDIPKSCFRNLVIHSILDSMDSAIYRLRIHYKDAVFTPEKVVGCEVSDLEVVEFDDEKPLK